MRWRSVRWKKRKKPCCAFVVDSDTGIRDKLADYFLKRPGYSELDISVCRARSRAEAQKKIDKGSVPDVVLFSENFSEEERGRLRYFLSYYGSAATFIMVPL